VYNFPYIFMPIYADVSNALATRVVSQTLHAVLAPKLLALSQMARMDKGFGDLITRCPAVLSEIAHIVVVFPRIRPFSSELACVPEGFRDAFGGDVFDTPQGYLIWS
jgi:hypothetical protein